MFIAKEEAENEMIFKKKYFFLTQMQSFTNSPQRMNAPPEKARRFTDSTKDQILGI